MLKEIKERRSVREYSDKEVEKEKIELIIRAAMQAPSARNQRPWHFLVLTKEKNINEITQISEKIDTMKFIKDASFVIIFMADTKKIPVKVMFDQDMSSAVTLSLIQATKLQIGSCWCGVYPRKDRIEIIRDVCNIKEYEPFALVAYGYPKDEKSLYFKDRFDEERIHYLG